MTPSLLDSASADDSLQTSIDEESECEVDVIERQRQSVGNCVAQAVDLREFDVVDVILERVPHVELSRVTRLADAHLRPERGPILVTSFSRVRRMRRQWGATCEANPPE